MPNNNVVCCAGGCSLQRHISHCTRELPRQDSDSKFGQYEKAPNAPNMLQENEEKMSRPKHPPTYKLPSLFHCPYSAPHSHSILPPPRSPHFKFRLYPLPPAHRAQIRKVHRRVVAEFALGRAARSPGRPWRRRSRAEQSPTSTSTPTVVATPSLRRWSWRRVVG